MLDSRHKMPAGRRRYQTRVTKQHLSEIRFEMGSEVKFLGQISAQRKQVRRWSFTMPVACMNA